MVYDVQIISSNFLAAIVRTAAACLKIEQAEIRETSARTRGLITDSFNLFIKSPPLKIFRRLTRRDVRLVVWS